MKIWIASMECAGIVEAGGVKNVTYSLCEGFSKAGHEVTLFIPVFATTRFDSLEDFEPDVLGTEISTCETNIYVSYSSAKFKNFKGNVILINHPAFSEKHGVYVYTQEEEQVNMSHKCGTGHMDMHFLDTILSKSVASYGTLIDKTNQPDIIHCQDAATAIIPSYIETLRPDFYKDTKCIVTIHNAGPAYHHEFKDSSEAYYYTELKYEWLLAATNNARIEPFLLASLHGHLSTVSDYYAQELQDPKNNNITDNLAGIFYERGIKIEGITNGIDYNRYDPENTDKSRLAYKILCKSGDFSGKFDNRKFLIELLKTPDNTELPQAKRFLSDIEFFGHLDDETSKSVYFVYHGRIVWQKGINLFLQASEEILKRHQNVKIIVCGQGEQSIEDTVRKFAENHQGRAVYIKGYNQSLSRLVVAASDFAAMPSHFEPCCLEDFIAQLYGTIPIAHATGGLQKIIHGKTGFLYKPNTQQMLSQQMEKAIELYHENKIQQMQIYAFGYVQTEYCWNKVIEKYLKYFSEI